MKQVKIIRGQVRQIVQEILPNVLTEEHAKVLQKHVDTRIDQIEEFIKKTMSEMNNRHKDTMGYLVRQVSSPVEEPKND